MLIQSFFADLCRECGDARSSEWTIQQHEGLVQTSGQDSSALALAAMMSLYSGLGYGNFDSQFIAKFCFCVWLSILSDRLFHLELPKAGKGKTE